MEAAGEEVLQVKEEGQPMVEDTTTTDLPSVGSAVDELREVVSWVRRNLEQGLSLISREADDYYDELELALKQNRERHNLAIKRENEKLFGMAQVLEDFVAEKSSALEKDPAYRAVISEISEDLARCTNVKKNYSWFRIMPNTQILQDLRKPFDCVLFNPMFSVSIKLGRAKKLLEELNNLNPPEAIRPNNENVISEAANSHIHSENHVSSPEAAPIEHVKFLTAKNPHEFYVFRRTSREPLITINKFFETEISNLQMPDSVECGHVYAVFTEEGDLRWHRGLAGRSCGNYINGSVSYPLYDFFLIDQGTSSDIRLCDIRVLPETILAFPPLATPCSLNSIVPYEGSSWPHQTCREFFAMLTKGDVGLKVYREEGGILYVDAVVKISEDKSIISVRDILLYRGLAALPSSGQERKVKPMETHGKVIRRGSFFAAIPSFVEEAGVVYFHVLNQAAAILNLQQQLETEFSNPATSYTAACFTPQKGRLCAAPYEGDYYRALIESVDDDGKVNVFFVDYGNRAKLFAQELRELHPRLAALPAQALRCKIRKVLPDDSFRDEILSSEECHVRVVYVHKGNVGRVGNRPELCFEVEVSSASEATTHTRTPVEEAKILSPAPSTPHPAKEDVAVHTQPMELSSLPTTLAPEVNIPATEDSAVPQQSSDLPPQPLTEAAAPQPLGAAAIAEESAESRFREVLGPLEEFALPCYFKFCQSPSLIFVQPVDLLENFEELYREMQIFYKNRNPQDFFELFVGSLCCVRYEDQFYRGRINDISREQSLIIDLIDFGKKILTSPEYVYRLEESHRHLNPGIIQCQLAGIEPRAHHWDDASISVTKMILVDSLVVYVQARGKPYQVGPGCRVTLPAELTVEVIDFTGTPVRFSLNDYLVEAGLAVRIPSQEVQRWIPAPLLQERVFQGTPTWIDYQGNVYVQNEEQTALAAELSQKLGAAYWNSQPDPGIKWRIGDICIAFYEQDGGWHRAQVVNIREEEDSYLIVFVDYGMSFPCNSSELRPLILPQLASIPLQVFQCKLQGVVPLNGLENWPITVLDKLHEKIVYKSCRVVVKNPEGQPPYEISLFTTDGEDIAKFLVDSGLAAAVEPIRIPQLPLPANEGADLYFPVMVEAVSANRVTLIPDAGTPVGEELEKLPLYMMWIATSDEINQMHLESRRNSLVPATEISPGSICFAVEGDHFNRAVIEEVLREGDVSINRIDFGKRDKKKTSHLFQLPEKYRRIPQFSFTAQLYHLKLGPDVAEGASSEKLAAATDKYPLFALFKGLKEGIPLVELYAFNEEEEKLALAYEDLIQEGIFQHSDE